MLKKIINLIENEKTLTNDKDIRYFNKYFYIIVIHSLNLRIQSENRKIRTRKTPYLETFHAVNIYYTSSLSFKISSRGYYEYYRNREIEHSALQRY